MYLASNASCQNSKDPILIVLTKQAIGKTFSFDSSVNKIEKNLIQITYLGKVETKTHINYYILTWARIWGVNEHTTGVILIYNTDNKYVGKYVLGSMYDLPNKINKNSLIFNNERKAYCDKSIDTRISFDSIPQNIFIRCKDNDGDIYSYSANK